MSFLSPKAPAPQPLPVSPYADEEARRKREEAERAALAESKTHGRRSTIVAGMQIAADEQQARGALHSSRRRGAQTVG